MVNTGKRKWINPSRDFERYFGQPTGKDVLLAEDHPLEKTMYWFPRVVKDTLPQAKAIANRLKGRTPQETCKNIWEWCFEYIQYKKDDPGKEQLRGTNRFYADRMTGVDCDCFAVNCSAMLLGLGIPHLVRVTKYPSMKLLEKPRFSHIYLVVPTGKGRETILDPVIHEFDFEVPFIEKIDVPMSLHYLNGLENVDFSALQGVDYDLFDHDDLGSILDKKRSAANEQRKKEALERGFHTNGVVTPQDLERYMKVWTEEFKASHQGLTPEQWSEKVRRETQQRIDANRRENAQREASQMEAMRKELSKRGVALTGRETHQELLDLLNNNPKPKRGAKIANALNRFNPATGLVRLGILAAVKINYLGLGKSLKYGLLPESAARSRRDIDYAKYQRMKNVYDKLLKAFYAAGGKKENLKKAFLEGRGNRKDRLTLSGPGSLNSLVRVLGPELVADELPDELSGSLSGLGEPVSLSAAITAATTVLSAIAVAVKAIGAVKKGELPPEQDPDTVNDFSQFENDPSALPDLPMPTAPSADPNVTAYPPGQAPLVMTTDPNSPDPSGDQKKGFGKWLKENKGVAIGVALGILGLTGGGIGYAVHQKKKKEGNLKGAPKGKRSTAKKTTTRKKTTRSASTRRKAVL